MRCYYHNADLDGICSAAIIKRRYPSCQLIGVNYGDNIAPDVNKNEIVYIVDFSFDLDTMETLNEKGNLIWIDHHRDVITRYVVDNDLGLIEMKSLGMNIEDLYLKAISGGTEQ